MVRNNEIDTDCDDESSTDDDSSLSSSYSSSSSSSSSSCPSLKNSRTNNGNDETECCDCEDCQTTTATTARLSNFTSKDDNENACVAMVRDWVRKVPIGRNLCPWAKLSERHGRTRYVVCPRTVVADVSEFLWEEIARLSDDWESSRRYSCCRCRSDGSSLSVRCRRSNLPQWTTTLVVCPNVEPWRNDFDAFDVFVKNFGKSPKQQQQSARSNRIGVETSGDEGSSRHCQQQQQQQQQLLLEEITLVAFHPEFVRWRALPESIQLESKVRCHAGISGFQKSPFPYPATVIEMRPKLFGQRRIKVKFDYDDDDDDKTDTTTTSTTALDPNHPSGKEQYVPIDWIVVEDKDADGCRPPLSDNAMHRAPYPVVHLIRNTDLASLCVRDISRLKRQNAQTMMMMSSPELFPVDS